MRSTTKTMMTAPLAAQSPTPESSTNKPLITLIGSLVLVGVISSGGAFAQSEPSSPETNTESTHQPLDDAALEEEYGITAGAVKRDEPVDDGLQEEPSAPSTDNNEENMTEGGTGGTGSPDDAIHESEAEQSHSEENNDGQ